LPCFEALNSKDVKYQISKKRLAIPDPGDELFVSIGDPPTYTTTYRGFLIELLSPRARRNILVLGKMVSVEEVNERGSLSPEQETFLLDFGVVMSLDRGSFGFAIRVIKVA